MPPGFSNLAHCPRAYHAKAFVCGRRKQIPLQQKYWPFQVVYTMWHNLHYYIYTLDDKNYLEELMSTNEASDETVSPIASDSIDLELSRKRSLGQVKAQKKARIESTAKVAEQIMSFSSSQEDLRMKKEQKGITIP